MPAVRIIPCLDVDEGRVVKGVRFADVRDAGDPAALARRYYEEGADEIAFLDVGATWRSRKILLEVVHRVASEVFVPLLAGGGLRSVEDIREALLAGADKVALCSSALKNPDLLAEAAESFGAQCIVLSIDAKKNGRSWIACADGGRRLTTLDAVEWAARGSALGAGEILLNSIDRDGTETGYDLELTAEIRRAVRVPVIASGGVGCLEHMREAVAEGGADAVLLASVLHFGRFGIPEIKAYLKEKGMEIR